MMLLEPKENPLISDVSESSFVCIKMEPWHSQNAVTGNLAFMKPKHCYLIFTLDTTIDIQNAA